MMNHDIRYRVVVIHQANILYGLSTLRGYRAYVEVINDVELWMQPKDDHKFPID